MNTLFLILVAIPAIEIFVMIKIGLNIGALSTVSLIFLTAIIGIYFAKIEGLNTLRSGALNLYKNKMPIYEIISGASIAFAAFLLIIPGFVTDAFGFLLLFPLTRKVLIKLIFKNRKSDSKKESDFIEGEIVEKVDKKDDI